MPTQELVQLMLGPAGGLLISLYFSLQFLRRFEQTTDRIVEAFQAELDGCNHRYQHLLNEFLRLRLQLGSEQHHDKA